MYVTKFDENHGKKLC